MNSRRTSALVIGMVIAGLLVAGPHALAQDPTGPDTAAPAQEKKGQEWTGRRRDGSVITRSDVREILHQIATELPANARNECGELRLVDRSVVAGTESSFHIVDETVCVFVYPDKKDLSRTASRRQ